MCLQGGEIEKRTSKRNKKPNIRYVSDDVLKKKDIQKQKKSKEPKTDLKCAAPFMESETVKDFRKVNTYKSLKAYKLFRWHVKAEQRVA